MASFAPLPLTTYYHARILRSSGTCSLPKQHGEYKLFCPWQQRVPEAAFLYPTDQSLLWRRYPASWFADSSTLSFPCIRVH